jgi:hypothetical protein
MTLSILITLLCPIRIDYISFRGESQATAVYSPKIPAKGMADGKVSVAYSNFLGYDKGENGNLVVNREPL